MSFNMKYLEAMSMRGLYEKINAYEDEVNKEPWSDFRYPKTINHLVIEKDGDMFCAIVSSSVPLVRGLVRTYRVTS